MKRCSAVRTNERLVQTPDKSQYPVRNEHLKQGVLYMTRGTHFDVEPTIHELLPKCLPPTGKWSGIRFR